jgi:multiple sugar transport system ATP-binding protein
MVFQNYALYPHMTAFDNMAFGLKLRKFPKSEIEKRVRETAEILGLTPYLDRKPQALSGGQRQRVAVGRAIVRKPKVFLFDEPLSNLDPQLRVQMRAEISKLHNRLEATMVYVTHDQIEAMTMGERIAVMSEGVIQQIADPLTLYDAPVNLFVAGFIGSPPMNFFKGILIQKGNELVFAEEAGAGRAGSGTFIVRIDPAHAPPLSGYVEKNLILGLRPEHMAPFCLSPEVPENTISAKIEIVEPLGSETYLHLATDSHSFIARAAAREEVKAGQFVGVALKMNEARFFDPTTGLAIA